MVPAKSDTDRDFRGVPRASGDGPAQQVRPCPAHPCSPRERGWSAAAQSRFRGREVFPARAGMVPVAAGSNGATGCVPRASGDGPMVAALGRIGASCSPRERGWSAPTTTGEWSQPVFPARAGMVRQAGVTSIQVPGVPRASGDGPQGRRHTTVACLCSPRERGWSRRPPTRPTRPHVFPARAGMVPPGPSTQVGSRCVPRASGDGPAARTFLRRLRTCSPRERGWSPGTRVHQAPRHVFPARAGMVRLHTRQRRATLRVPRASGDGPSADTSVRVAVRCSPRERGWSPSGISEKLPVTVFPARAGMVRRRSPCSGPEVRVPRASGDGPDTTDSGASHTMCSPRERGWSARGHRPRREHRVFPARAGMVPSRAASFRERFGVPRASGDGPPCEHTRMPRKECSPRERGWSLGGHLPAQAGHVFPARAGMVRRSATRSSGHHCVPRASGDGPAAGSNSPRIIKCSPRERGWSRLFGRVL